MEPRKQKDARPKSAMLLSERFATDAERLADLQHRKQLRRYRERLGMTVPELRADLTRLQGATVNFWAVRAWLADQDSARARAVPSWALRLLEIGHPAELRP